MNAAADFSRTYIHGEGRERAINGIQARPSELRRHLSGYRQFATQNKNKKSTAAIIGAPKRAHAERTSAHTSCEISRNIELQAR